MIRQVLIELGLFFAPFVAYAVYLWSTKPATFDWDHWPPRVLAVLGGVAVVLTIGAFVVVTHFTGAPPGSTYEPAHVENGKLVPGRVVP